MVDTERAVFETHIKGTIEEVWRQITKTDEPQECFFNMHMDTSSGELGVGKPIRMRTKDPLILCHGSDVDMRTAAFINAIDKILVCYEELGIFP